MEATTLLGYMGVIYGSLVTPLQQTVSGQQERGKGSWGVIQTNHIGTLVGSINPGPKAPESIVIPAINQESEEIGVSQNRAHARVKAVVIVAGSCSHLE